MKLDNFYHLEYSVYYLHLQYYIYNILADAPFDLRVFYVKLESPHRTSNQILYLIYGEVHCSNFIHHDQAQVLSHSKYSFNQLEPTYSSSVPIWDVALKTCWKQWTIEKGGKKGSDADDATWWSIPCYLPIVGIEPATSKWFHLEILFNQIQSQLQVNNKEYYHLTLVPGRG